jgi:hypothetical protein
LLRKIPTQESACLRLIIIVSPKFRAPEIRDIMVYCLFGAPDFEVVLASARAQFHQAEAGAAEKEENASWGFR